MNPQYVALPYITHLGVYGSDTVLFTPVSVFRCISFSLFDHLGWYQLFMSSVLFYL